MGASRIWSRCAGICIFQKPNDGKVAAFSYPLPFDCICHILQTPKLLHLSFLLFVPCYSPRPRSAHSPSPTFPLSSSTRTSRPSTTRRSIRNRRASLGVAATLNHDLPPILLPSQHLCRCRSSAKSFTHCEFEYMPHIDPRPCF